VNPAPLDSAQGAAEIARLEQQVAALQDARVEDWVRLVRFGSVVPRAVETSLSWRLTRPVRLAQVAFGVLKRDGANRFWATVRARLRRRFS
jgi:hypothetical protein